MKWQSALTKKQLAHLRWTVNGDSPTLHRFKTLRKGQRKLEAHANAEGFKFYIACHDCDAIEYRLKERGVIDWKEPKTN